jgi:GntR family transcriptional regulator, hexuronate regulon transcriptional repressor
VVQKISDAISAGTYQVGDRLPAERDLAKKHAVGRGTVREAIKDLAARQLVDVRRGSGVYVAGVPTTSGMPVPMDIDPFELSEARLLFEGEVAAQAASQITDKEIDELDRLLVEMEHANRRGTGEEADRQFHRAIALATRNAAMTAVVDALWSIRLQSPKCVTLFARSRRRGTKPVIAEHRSIVEALRSRNPKAAREAMRAHLQQVLNYLLDASERDALTEVRTKVSERRSRFAPLTRTPAA